MARDAHPKSPQVSREIAGADIRKPILARWIVLLGNSMPKHCVI